MIDVLFLGLIRLVLIALIALLVCYIWHNPTVPGEAWRAMSVRDQIIYALAMCGSLFVFVSILGSDTHEHKEKP